MVHKYIIFNLILYILLTVAITPMVFANGMGTALVTDFSTYIAVPIFIVVAIRLLILYIKNRANIEKKERWSIITYLLITALLIIILVSPFLSTPFVDKNEMKSCYLDHYGPRKLCSLYEGSVRGLIFYEFVPLFILGFILYTIYYILIKWILKKPIEYLNSRIFLTLMLVSLTVLILITINTTAKVLFYVYFTWYIKSYFIKIQSLFT